MRALVHRHVSKHRHTCTDPVCVHVGVLTRTWWTRCRCAERAGKGEHARKLQSHTHTLPGCLSVKGVWMHSWVPFRVCKEGYYKSGGKCIDCGSDAQSVVPFVFTIIILFLLGLLFHVFVNAPQSRKIAVTLNISLTLGMLINFMQNLTYAQRCCLHTTGTRSCCAGDSLVQHRRV